MRRLTLIFALALTVAACASATPYQPAGPGSSRGYSEYRVEDDRWRVTFSGNSATTRETVEMYLLYRTAELTLANGFEWFRVAERSTERDARYVASPDPFWGTYWGPHWRPYWRSYRRGYWSPWDPYWSRDFDVREIERFEATAEIVMGRGAKPADDGSVFDARDVVENLRPRIVYPATQ